MADEGVEGVADIVQSENLEAPELSSESIHYLVAFQRLSSSRSVGMGLGAIPLSELTNYCTYFEELEPMIFIDVMLRIDNSYMQIHLEKKDGKRS